MGSTMADHHAACQDLPAWDILQFMETGGNPGNLPASNNKSGDEQDAAREGELLKQLRAGDDDAFATLVRLYGGRMLAVARRMMGNEDDARDVIQDAFLSAIKALDRFKGESRLSTWLHRIVVNAALMKIRSRKRKPEEFIEDLQPRFGEKGHLILEDPWSEPSDRLLEREETRRTVRAAIEQLPDGYRTVLVMRDIEGLDTQETARLLDLTANAVKIRLHRGRLALRSLLGPQFAGGLS